MAKVYSKSLISLAGELGFEPRQTESEFVVLPLHHSPMIAAYRFNNLSVYCGNACDRIAKSRAKRAPFYSLWSRPWQARGDALVARDSEPAALSARGRVADGARAHERRISRNWIFVPPRWACLACGGARQLSTGARYLRNQTRRRVSDVEPVHRRRDRAGAARPGCVEARAISMSSLAASGSATPRRRCWKIRPCDRLIVVDALAEVIEWHAAGLAAARQATDR